MLFLKSNSDKKTSNYIYMHINTNIPIYNIYKYQVTF